MRHAHRSLLILSTALILIAAVNCSRKHDPISAAEAESPDTLVGTASYLLPGVNQHELGTWRIEIENDQAQLLPNRAAQLAVGAQFQLDVTTALTETICWDCLTLTSVRRSGKAIELEFDLRHPIPLADTFVPPSAKNRRDLWLNNVKGVLLLDGNQTFLNNSVTLDPELVTNADGWTDLVKRPITYDSNIYPYKVFGATGANLTTGNFSPSSGWYANADDPIGYNIFANDQHATATYRLALAPGATLAFDLTLTANWMISAASLYERLLPKYYLPAGASPEAWRATVTPSGELEAENPASAIDLTFEVLDWQQDPSLTVDPAFPTPGSHSKLATSSRVAAVSFSLPAITGEAITNVPLAGATGRGLASDPYRISYHLSNTTGALPGSYLGVAKILDERTPTNAQKPQQSVLFLEKDLETSWVPSSEFATWTVFRVTVGGGITGCLNHTIIRSGLFGSYIAPNPLYTLARTPAEAANAIAQVEAQPAPLPAIDFSRQSLVVAATGRTPDGRGQRTIAIGSVCPEGPDTWRIGLKRGEPLSACQAVALPASPYLIAIVDIAPATHALVEEQFDTCTASSCISMPFRRVLRGNGAANGYQGAPLLVYAANQEAYEDYAGPLLGEVTPPFINFPYEEAVIISSGYSAAGDTGRDILINDLCMDAATGYFELYYTKTEYLSCPAPTPPLSGPDAPFEIIAVPCCSLLIDPRETVANACLPPVCETELTPTVLLQADARNSTSGPASTARYEDPTAFAAAWSTYFPEVAPPVIDFASRDAYLIADITTAGAGLRWLSLQEICFSDSGTPTVNVHYTKHDQTGGGCIDANGESSRPVLLFTTQRPPVPATVVFTPRSSSACGPEICTGPQPALIEQGDLAVSWDSGGVDLLMGNRAMFQHLWERTHGTGIQAPAIDFTRFDVLFTTSGYHPSGRGLHDQIIPAVCSEDVNGRAMIIEREAQTCPDPSPEPTTPYSFVEIPRGHGAPGGSPIWYAFSRSVADRCDPSETCIPELAINITIGGGSPNQSVGTTKRLIKDQEDLDLFWEAWFAPSAEFYEKPVIDWNTHDILFYATGSVEQSYASRSVWARELCIDADAQYVNVDFLRYELDEDRCPGFDYPTHPWTVVLLPAGAAEGWTVETSVETRLGCPGEIDFPLPATEIAHSLTSDYTGVPSFSQLCNETDFAERLQSYRDTWAYLGPGDPPGIAVLTPVDAIVILGGGYLSQDYGRHDVFLDSLTAMYEGRTLRLRPRVTLPFTCDGEPQPTSPYRILKVPMMQLGHYEDFLGADDACD